MNYLSRFLRALPSISAVFVAGAAALHSGQPAQAKTLSFTALPSPRASLPLQSQNAFVRVGVPPVFPPSTAASAGLGGFSTLVSPVNPSTRGFRLAAAGVTDVAFEATSYTVREDAGILSTLVKVTRSGDTTLTTKVDYASADGTAKQPADYTTTSGTLTFNPGETSKFIPIQIASDSVAELSETFTITLSNQNSGNGTTTTLSTATTNININDDDSTVQFSQDGFIVNEGAGTASLTVTRTGDTTSPTSVDYSFTDITAVEGQDFTGQTSTINFGSGVTSRTITVPIADDSIDEDDETFKVTLSVTPGTASSTYTNLGTPAAATVTIKDNDDTVVGFTQTSYQVNEAAGSILVTVRRSGDTSRAFDLQYQTLNGTAQATTDYTTTSGTLSFAANQVTSTINIPITNDGTPENDEAFTVRLSSPAFKPPPTGNVVVTVNPTTTTITIKDDDPAVNFAATTYSVDEAAGSVTLNLERTNSTVGTATVTYTTSNGSATDGQDYTGGVGTVTFANGESTQSIVIPITADALNEATETFTVTLSKPLNTSLGPDSTATVSILDDDPIPTLTVDDVTAPNADNASLKEDDLASTGLTFRVRLNAVSGRTVIVSYSTADGSATDGLISPGTPSTTEDTDYTAKSGTLVIPPGTASRTINIAVSGDSKFEGDEGFILSLDSATNATIDRKKAVGTILNDDPAPTSTFNFSPVSPSVLEANGSVTLNVTRTGDTSTAASVTVNTADGTAVAGADYTAVSTVLSFNVNETSKTVTVPILDESINEADETFTATLSSPVGYATLGANSTATVTITNDDAAPTLTVGSASVTEGDSGTTNLTFTATLDATSEQTISVNYATSNVTATAGSDYTATSGTLTFTPGETSKSISVVVNGDTAIENNETLSLLFTNPQNVTLSSSKATGTILNDDTPPTVSNVAFTATSIKVNEGVGNATLTVKRTTGADRAATVNYSTANGTAKAGSDYTAQSGTLTFPVGVTTATITVPITDDTLKEPGAAETFTVTLSNPGGNAQLPAQKTATVSITDNEGTPTLSVVGGEIQEGDSGRSSLPFTVSLVPQSMSTVKVQIATTGGTATSSGSGADYTARTATLTFAPGQSTQTFAVSVIGDAIVEPDETVTVKLSNPQGAPLDSKRTAATGTIDNDDEPGGGGTITFLAGSYAVNENAGTATITLGRSGNIDLINEQSATVRFTTGTGSATPGKDYKPINTIVTFPAGETTVSVNIPITDDTVYEEDETVSMALTSPSNNAILGSTTTATLTITDNDPVSPLPRADSISPAAPSGSPFTVTSTYSIDTATEKDGTTTQGVNNLSPVLIQIGGNASGGGFRALYDASTNLLSVDPTTGQKARPGARVVLTNQYGSLDVSKTTVQRTGNQLIVTWRISLNATAMLPIYTGATNNVSGQSVFVRRGTWRPASTTTSSISGS